MNQFDKIIKLIDSNFIYCLIPIVITLIISNKVFKDKVPTKEALKIIKWSIIIYTTIILIQFTFNLFVNNEFFQFIDRATGPYKFAYLLMLSCSVILPFTLLIKKIGNKIWYVLAISILMKIGVYFERFVILVTSLHRDSLTSSWESNTLQSWTYSTIIFATQGVIISALILLTIKMLQKKKQYTTQG